MNLNRRKFMQLCAITAGGGVLGVGKAAAAAPINIDLGCAVWDGIVVASTPFRPDAFCWAAYLRMPVRDVVLVHKELMGPIYQET